MKANTILKNKFKKIKFDGHNQDEIQNIIDQNREEIICETFRNKIICIKTIAIQINYLKINKNVAG